jgi:hypothetical protein
MGRRNTRPKSNLQLIQWLDSFPSVNSKKTLPCLGLIEYSPVEIWPIRLTAHNPIGELIG